MAFLRFNVGSRGEQPFKFNWAFPAIGVAALLGWIPTTQGALSLPPGVRPCVTNATPAGYGTFLLLQQTTYIQTGESAPSESATPPPNVVAELTSPSAFSISNALVANTRGFSLNLPYQPDGSSAGSSNFVSESALLAATLPGAWNTSFQLVFPGGESFVGFSVFTVASNTAPVPRISDFSGAQAINPTAAFAVNWAPWIGSVAQDRIALVITDSTGRIVLSAATDCSGQASLPTGATGFTVPPGTLAPGTDYMGYLTFGASLTASQDDGAFLLQRAFHSRTTRFSLRTSGGGSGQPGTLSRPTVTPTSLTFTLTGSPGVVYAVQSASNLGTWTEQTRVTLPASGSAEVTLPLPANGETRFYRAIAVGGGGTPGTGATLSISATNPTRIRLTVSGQSGSSHIIQASTNFATWIDLGTLTILEGDSNVVFTAAVPVGSVSTVYRALAVDVAPPPQGKRPTLSAIGSATGIQVRLAGGDANRSYTVQQANEALTTWTATPVTISTGADGSGQATIPTGTTRSAVLRVEAR